MAPDDPFAVFSGKRLAMFSGKRLAGFSGTRRLLGGIG
jgi:hypothetical protein